MKRSYDWGEELFTVVVKNEEEDGIDIFQITVDFEKDGIYLNKHLFGEEFYINIYSQIKNRFLEWAADEVKEDSTISISQIDGFVDADRLIYSTVTFYKTGDIAYKRSVLTDLSPL